MAARRTFLRAFGAAAGAALLPRAAPAEPGPGFDALTRAAPQSAKAQQATMLAIARAGTRLVAAGERGIVLLSDDGAQTWRQADVPVSVALTAVRFVDEKRGWAVGHLGVVLHSEDGGEHWRLQLDGLRAARLTLAAADDNPKARAAAQSLVDDGPDKPFLDVCFENPLTGYAVGAFGLAYRTDDGGATWRSWMTRMSNPKGLHLYAMLSHGGALYVAGEQGLLLRSSDGGQHFDALPTPSKGTFFGAAGGRDGELLLFGLRGRAFRTADAAQSWSEIDTGAHASLSAGSRLSDGRWVLASQSGELMISQDAARGFKSVGLTSSLPATGLAETRGGAIALATLRGVRRVELPATA